MSLCRYLKKAIDLNHGLSFIQDGEKFNYEYQYIKQYLQPNSSCIS